MKFLKLFERDIVPASTAEAKRLVGRQFMLADQLQRRGEIKDDAELRAAARALRASAHFLSFYVRQKRHG